MTIHNAEQIRQHQAHAAIRARLLNAPFRPQPSAEPQPETQPRRYMAMQIPLWEREAITFNAHIVDFRAWQHEQYERQTAKGYIISRCEEFGASYTIMIGPSRHRPISNLRQILYFEVHENFGRSFPQIGRLFGGRDHTTALHGYRKVKAMTLAEREEVIREAVQALNVPDDRISKRNAA
jgi:hypothetical protein